MKEYPLTGPEMWQLATVGIAATIFFSGGTFLLSSWFDFQKDLAIPPSEMTAEMVGYWRAMRDASFWGAVVCFVGGCVLAGANGLTIHHIINCTEHPE